MLGISLTSFGPKVPALKPEESIEISLLEPDIVGLYLPGEGSLRVFDLGEVSSELSTAKNGPMVRNQAHPWWQ